MQSDLGGDEPTVFLPVDGVCDGSVTGHHRLTFYTIHRKSLTLNLAECSQRIGRRWGECA